MYPGVFLLGAVSTYAYLERGFVLPGVVVVGPYLVALWFEARGNPDQADLISTVGIYLFGGSSSSVPPSSLGVSSGASDGYMRLEPRYRSVNEDGPVVRQEPVDTSLRPAGCPQLLVEG
jgi:hypothetical protein